MSRAWRSIGLVIAAGSLLIGCRAIMAAAVVAGAAGASSGLLVSPEFARLLATNDQMALSNTTERTADTGQAVTFSNPDTGVSGRTTVVRTTTQQAQVPIKALKDRLQSTPPIELLQSTYRAGATTNIRGGPGTDYVVVGSLSRGETVEVVGRVKGADWFLVAENGLASGYVAASQLSPEAAQVTAAAPAPAAGIAPSTVGQAAAAPVRPPAPDISSDAVQEITFSSDRVCRVITQEVTLPDTTTRSEDITVCQNADGWEIV
jgi:uncharacterized protein YgiM (DUF1202 family)